MLGVKPGKFGGSFLRQDSLFAELPKAESQTTLGALDGCLEGRAKPNL